MFTIFLPSSWAVRCVSSRVSPYTLIRCGSRHPLRTGMWLKRMREIAMTRMTCPKTGSIFIACELRLFQTKTKPRNPRSCTDLWAWWLLQLDRLQFGKSKWYLYIYIYPPVFKEAVVVIVLGLMINAAACPHMPALQIAGCCGLSRGTA